MKILSQVRARSGGKFSFSTRIIVITLLQDFRFKTLTIPADWHMRRFPEPQHFFAAPRENWDLRCSKEGRRQTLLKLFLSYFQNNL